MRIRKTIWSAATLAAALALPACSSAPPAPTTISLTVAGATALNPDPSGRASPVMLRLYQLGPSDAFANADFFQVIDQDKATLGPTLLDRQEMAVQPGSRQTVTIQPKPDVRILAVAAAFRAYEEAGWRAMLAVEPNKANRFVLTAKASAITLTRRGEDDDESGDTAAETPDGNKPEGDKPEGGKPKTEGAKPDQQPAAKHNLIVKGPS
ncbi:hypothetical protein AZL_017960 [Azospirillum sp. B510]|uniref:type VI secretion system lipoprotein TssJ n=1 Tax=Azospirillum sp. (strain B510) TaxID=137722 RepID=UPI0001C4C170|nr:type VI secretion system lipoprotein TssJ [Azospirillum sp. B510]BAI72434.1 hypothetical protein AZL_017960 [Azospirillum sp. B510]